MLTDICHFGIHVHSLKAAKTFYVDKLGLEVIQFMPALNFMAVRAGGIRISIFADVSPQGERMATMTGGHIIFRTPSLADTINTLIGAGIHVPEISEAPGSMKYIGLHDPSGNVVGIAEYLCDPF